MKSIKPRRKEVTSADLEKSFNQALGQPVQKAAPALPVVGKEPEPPKERSVKLRAKAVKKSKTTPVKRVGKTRVTIDLPDDLYKAMEQNKEETGQSFTFFISKLIKKHFKQAQ